VEQLGEAQHNKNAKMTLPTEAKSWTSFVRFEPIAKLSSHHQILFWFFLPANTLKNSANQAAMHWRLSSCTLVAAPPQTTRLFSAPSFTYRGVGILCGLLPREVSSPAHSAVATAHIGA